MKETLYLRIVLTFIIAVTIGLFVAFFVSASLYKSQMMAQAEEDLMRAGKEIIKLYENADIEDIDGYLKSISSMHYRITLQNKEGARFYGITSKGIVFLEEGAVSDVLRGKTYKKVHQNKDGSSLVTIGLPFQIKGEPYALFIEPSYEEYYKKLNKFLKTVLFIVLAVGCMVFVIAARYLVKPLKLMTDATKELAKGNFDVNIKVYHQDELGTLATSFNRMAKELSQLEKMRKEFISNVSHELRSPLTSIRGFSQAIKDGGVTEEEKVEYLQIIQNEAERLSKLSENLLSLASLDAEQFSFNPRLYRLDEQIRRVIVSHQPQWHSKNLQFCLSLPETSIFADELQLEQVWTNLLTNGIKYTPENGKIKVSLWEDGRKLLVSISDTGIGISEEEQKHIFQRFYTVEKSRNKAFSGSGLGLSIAEKIISLHDGKIEVKSEPGKGSEFIVIIPKRLSNL